MKSLQECLLYAFVDSAYLHGRSPERVARELCEGGADLIQLRAKNSPAEEIRAWAEQIAPVTRQAGAGLVINDFPEIAREVGAEFCHLGQEDFFDAGLSDCAQLRAGTHLRIGLSSHAPEQALRAISAGADYIAIGPVYPTGTKPSAQPVTLSYVRWAAENVRMPWFAIGGINLETIDEVIEAGAKRVCVVSAILNAPDIREACKSIRKRLSSAL
jgi:thiamine-phosphate pyrophosphorylase